MSDILTPTTELESLDKGRYRQTIHLKPIAYNDGGVFKRIGNRLAALSVADGLSVGVDELATFRIRPAITGNAPLYEFEHGDGRVRFTPLETANVTGVVVDNAITYPSAWPNADLRLLMAGHRLDEHVLLRKGHPARFAFRMDESTGFDAKTLTFGKTGFRLLQPVLLPGAGHDAVPIPLVWEVTTSGGKYVLTVALPEGDWAGWTLDPTFTSQPDGTDGVDTWLARTAATSNFGTNNTGYLKAGDYYWLVKFDYSTLSGVTVTDGSLFTYAGGTARAGDITIYAHAVLAANDGWTEAGATWNTKDGSNAWAGDSGSDGGSDAGCSQSGTDYNATAMGSAVYGNNDASGTEYEFASLNTSQLQAQIDGDNYGLVLVNNTSSAKEHWSSDAATAGYRPKMVVTYTAGGTTQYGAAALSGAGALAAAGYRRVWAGVTLAGTGALTAAARRTRYGAATLPGAGALSSVAMARRFAAATLAADGALQAQAIRALYGAAVLAGVGQLTATGRRQLTGGATLSGSATLTATAQRIAYAAAALGGVGQLLATARLIARGRASLAGVGGLAAALTELVDNANLVGTVNLAGTWSTDVALAGTWSTDVALSGAWDQTVQLEGSVT